MKPMFRPASTAAMLLTILLLVTVSDFGVNVADAQTGYTVDYLDSWPVNGQIKYIRVFIKPISGTSAEDLDFHVVANSDNYRNGTTVSTIVPIRKGDTSATGELYVPVSGAYNFSLHTELDGDHNADRSDYAYHQYYDYQYSNQSSTDSTPSFAFASSGIIADESTHFLIRRKGKRSSMPNFVSVATTDEFSSLHDLDLWYGSTNVNVGGGRNVMSINGFTSPNAAAMSLEALPSKWFGYEGLGLLILTFDDLKLLSTKHPSKLLAIERWVAASGRLVILNCGDSFEKVDDAIRLLGEDNEAIRNDLSCTHLQSEVDKDKLQLALDEALEESQLNVGYNPYVQRTIQTEIASSSVSLDLASGKLKKRIQSAKVKDFIAIDFEAGQVVCVSDRASDWSEQRPENDDAWGSLGLFLKRTARKTLGGEHNLLNGDTIRNFGFPEFVEPPRYLFEFSILAYLFAVGPVAFYLLKRKHKLNLMFVVVPVISTIFCAGILCWAVFAEGFDTRVNQFTFTSLNQKTGRQTTSSVSHVYSGMTPSSYRLGGPNYGFINMPNDGRYLRIDWSDEGEALSGGEIRARTNHQLFTRCSNETEGKLSFSLKSDGEFNSPSVRNDFDTPIVCLCFKSKSCARNEVWVCEGIEPGAIADARKMTFSDAASLLRNEIRERGSSTVLASGKNYASLTNSYSYNRYGTEIASIESSDVSSQLRRVWHMSENQLSRMFLDVDDVYFAITEESTNHETAIPNAKMETKIHIIQGVR